MVADDEKLYAAIREDLNHIRQRLDTDIATLKNVIDSKEAEINRYKEQAETTVHEIEGSRQLINKLLGDLSKLQNDIDWYKRTYEQRSFLGTIKEKIFAKQKRKK